MKLKEMSRAQLEAFRDEALREYEDFKSKGLSLDMSRGKPSKEQLDLSKDMLTCISENADCYDEAGTDCRNYGSLAGIPSARKLIF